MKSALYSALRDAIRNDVPAASATVVSGSGMGNELVLIHPDTVVGSLDDPALDAEVTERLRSILTDGGAGSFEVQDSRIFVESHLPPPHLVVIGAVHIAIPLVQIAQILGYKTTVIDARGVFATEERFPDVGDLIEAWPDEGLQQINLHPGVAAVVLAHDEKFEDPAMEFLLKSDVGYIGAIGSRETSAQRRVRLQALGFTQQDLDRIHGPVGLNLGGRSPAEIALAIMAQIIAVRYGKDQSTVLAAAKSG